VSDCRQAAPLNALTIRIAHTPRWPNTMAVKVELKSHGQLAKSRREKLGHSELGIAGTNPAN